MANRTGTLPADFPEAETLHGKGIDTYEALAATPDDDLLAIDGFGPKKLKAVRAAGASTEEEQAEASSDPAHQLVTVRVLRDKYHRHGQEFRRGARLRVPRYVLDAQAKRGGTPDLEEAPAES